MRPSLYILSLFLLAALGGCRREGAASVAASESQKGEAQLFARALSDYSQSARRAGDYAVFAARVSHLRRSKDPDLRARAELRLAFLPAPLLMSSDAGLSESEWEQVVTGVWPVVLSLQPEEGEGAARFVERVCLEQPDLGCAIGDDSARLARVRDEVLVRFAAMAKGAYEDCEDCQDDEEYRSLLSRLRLSADQRASRQTLVVDPALTN